MLSAGTKLGSYEILSQIGAGGMGEVYRARDTKLGRDVAIKVLPDNFAQDAERMARFQREAKVLASLDHPNIASIFGLEDSGNTRALVMQLAEGPTLADRIAQGPLPIDDALRIARQIADALEYAHEKGIIHRDLKPANIKVAPDDSVKILDFGLAKALESEAAFSDISTSPTLSRLATQAGILLGTAAYMSPEQAKAKPVDRRADIWAFGCVLFEMLTGKKAFDGETVPETLGAIMRAEPDWAQLQPATPMRVRVLLQRCLQKDVRQRLQAMGDARISLEEVLSGAPEGTSSPAVAPPIKQRRWLASGIAVALALAAIVGVVVWNLKPSPRSALAEPMRFEIPVPEKTSVAGTFQLSPDGRKLAFAATGAGGQSQIWVRSLETLEARPLDGTEGVNGAPFWSPDSRFIAFGAQGKLEKIEGSGGPALALCDAPAGVIGGAWSRGDKIIFGSTAGVWEVAAVGGSASIITDGASVYPSFLPDGRHFAYTRLSNYSAGSAAVYLGSVDTKPKDQRTTKLLDDFSTAQYVPSADSTGGYLVFVRGATGVGAIGTLMAQPFDVRRLELAGEAVPLAEKITNLSFWASSTNVLIYFTGAGRGATLGSIQGRLTWFDRDGKVLGTIGDPGIYRNLALSPDGKRVAFEHADPQNSGNLNIWLYEFTRGIMTRFTFDSARDIAPIWSPDGSLVVFASNRSGQWDLYRKASNLAGEAAMLFKSDGTEAPSSWSPDGRFLLYYNFISPSHLRMLPVGDTGADRKPVQVEHSEFNQSYGRFSPDGRWIAYASDESGRDQIYVRPFNVSSATGTSAGNNPPVTGKWMVSKDGGIAPLWRRDGKELFYLSLDGTAMSVEVSTSGIFQAGTPRPLFRTPEGVEFWDVSTDGKRFLMAAPSAASPSSQPPFTVVLNWQALLKK
jgi:serine/threonine protein kinase/roadblock/LC7 domain-containing protein